MQVLSSESDWCHLCGTVRGNSRKSLKGTDKVFLDLFESRGKKDEGERGYGCVLICGKDIWYLLYVGSEEEEYICVFGVIGYMTWK